ncbi:MAG: hypothetical protein OEZ07_00510, partial [Dehalococcoidia bacterium]|nr:hypothetical protein [Dehalococcoidia bacterium]
VQQYKLTHLSSFFALLPSFCWTIACSAGSHRYYDMVLSSIGSHERAKYAMVLENVPGCAHMG